MEGVTQKKKIVLTTDEYDSLLSRLERRGMKTSDAIDWINARYDCEDTEEEKWG